MSEESQAYYGGVEPTEVGNLDQIREQRSFIPATRGVRFKIKNAEIRVNQANTYRSINLQLQLVEGIDTEGKYRGKVVFSRVNYYADPTVYTKDFFKKKQNLIALKQLSRATGIDLSKVDGHTPEQLTAAPDILGNITVRKRPVYEDGQEVTDENGQPVYEMENEVRNFSAMPTEQLV